jgi:hypothetical protein
MLSGSAVDATDGVLEASALTWSSDLDGALGVGESLTTSQLSMGEHRITLRARDLDGNTSIDTIRITVVRASPHTVEVYFNVQNTGTQPNRIWGLTGSVEGAVDTNGQATSMQIELIDSFENKAYDRFHLLAHEDAHSRIRISGLSQQLLYNFHGAIPISDRIQAQDFTDSFEAEITGNSKDEGTWPGLLNVNGSWSDYSIEVDTAGDHVVSLRASGNLDGSVAKVYSDGNLVGSIEIGNTGSWTAWDTFTGAVTLPAGEQTLRIEQDGAFRLNWIDIPGARLVSAPIKTIIQVGQNSAVIDPYSDPYGVLSGIVPDSDGQIFLDVDLAAESLVGYLGELKIVAYTNPNPPVPDTLSSGLTQDLFAYWTFDEGTGASAADGTGNHDGTISGATWDTSTGKFGNALSFDGTSDDVSVGSGNPVGSGDTLTLSLWATADSLSDSSNSLNGLIGKRNGYDSTMPFQFGIKQLVPRIERSGSGASFGAAVGTELAGWTGYKHIVLTLSGTTATVYIDGVVHGTGIYELGTDTDAPLTIGSTAPMKAEWDGNIDDVAIWSRALSAEEVQFIYASGVEGLALGQISGFSSWAIAFGLDGSAGKESGMNDNPDGDDLSNLGEFALAGDPLSSNDGAKFFVLPNSDSEPDAEEVCYTIAVRSGAPVFSGNPLTSSVGGIRYTVTASVDLIDFNETVLVVDPQIDGLSVLPSGYEYRSFCLDGSEAQPAAGFFRVTVSEVE